MKHGRKGYGEAERSGTIVSVYSTQPVDNTIMGFARALPNRYMYLMAREQVPTPYLTDSHTRHGHARHEQRHDGHFKLLVGVQVHVVSSYCH